MNTKGILLAGGSGSRLYPITQVLSKQMQPIYNKPMIYYSLTTLIMSGLRDILIISTEFDLPMFKELLGDGSQWGLRLSYEVQNEPKGIAQALHIGADFIGDDGVFVMLGDNIVYGDLEFLRESISENGSGEATVFAYQVRNPSAYGIVEFDDEYRGISLEEKPVNPRSNWAVPGMYIFSPGVAEIARKLKPSARGEYEITDVNRVYLDRNCLNVKTIGRGLAWFDAGTPEGLLNVGNFVHAIETRQGLTIGCPEEAAYNIGFIDEEGFNAAIREMPHSLYRETLERISSTIAARQKKGVVSHVGRAV